MTVPDADDRLRLASAGLAPSRVDRLVHRYGSFAAAVHAVVSGRVDIAATVRDAVAVPAEQRQAELAERGIEFSVPDGTGPWVRLDRHAGAPPWLYARGSVPAGPTIAIVGTRTCTTYGSELANGYGQAAAAMGWNVVSGMARGIDGAAHRGALEAGGSTIAVLGSGIDVVYPRSHLRLSEDILRSGALLSEFPPGTRPDGWRFPTRNRIISGSSDVVLVVEAGTTGGALITARIALDQGVPVFATPGDVDREASAGTNLLIRDGAFPVLLPDDLGQTLELLTPLVRA